MLDQNTDRMWFVIGAVIVGAAIIFIANGTLPTLFASVSDSFEESANKGTEVISQIQPYLSTDGINRVSNLTPWAVLYWVDGQVHRHGEGGDFYWADGDVVLDANEVEPGGRYMLTIKGIDLNDPVNRELIRGPFYYNDADEYIASEYSIYNGVVYDDSVVFRVPEEIVGKEGISYHYRYDTGDNRPTHIRFSFDKILHILDVPVEELDIRLEKVMQ